MLIIFVFCFLFFFFSSASAEETNTCSLKKFFKNEEYKQPRKKPKYVHVHISGFPICWEAPIENWNNWANNRPDEIVTGGLFEDPQFVIAHWSNERGWIKIVMIDKDELWSPF